MRESCDKKKKKKVRRLNRGKLVLPYISACYSYINLQKMVKDRRKQTLIFCECGCSISCSDNDIDLRRVQEQTSFSDLLIIIVRLSK